MTKGTFRQFFGPSGRYPRSCVEISFPVVEGTFSLGPAEPALTELGLTLGQPLPPEPLPLEEAVCRLASAILTRGATWWSAHGRADGRAFAAIGYPFPPAAVLALGAALDLVSGGLERPSHAVKKLATISGWLTRDRKIRMPMFRVAELLGRDFAIVTFSSKHFQIGQGAKGLHFHRAVNERDSLTALWLEENKHISAEALHRLGLPATHGVLAENEREAVAAIERVGLPCVVKPVAMGQGKGVETGLRNAAEVAAAARRALALSDKPIRVENHVAGADHRLMVVGDELLWAYRRVPARVTGDGKSTIRELIARENRRRTSMHEGPEAYLQPISDDDELERLLAARHGIGPDAIVPRGERIDVAEQPNTLRGGSIEDVTAEVHPDNRALAIRASRLFRLRTIGIDFKSPDISRSWKDVPCAILEVNRSPLVSGVGEAALLHRTLFPNRRSGCIPMVAVIGEADYRERQAGTVRAAFSTLGVRLVAADYLERSDEEQPFASTPVPPDVETLLLDPEADAGLVLCDPARVEEGGLPLARCDLALVEDPARSPWLAGAVSTIFGGEVTAKQVERAAAALVRTYQDPAEGGPLPVLEPLEGGAPNEFGLKVWCVRTMPRAWFWEQVGMAWPETAGMATQHDLLAAVRTLAARELATRKIALPAEFAHGELSPAWVRATFEATIALPAKNADAAHGALLAAVARVNAVAAMKIV
jgi:D-alanine-D-alanine ligase-like ATP-grasp enzyme